MSRNTRFHLIYVWGLEPEAFFLFGVPSEVVSPEATMVYRDSIGAARLISTSKLHKLYSPAATPQKKNSPVHIEQASAWAYTRIRRFGEYIYD